MCTHPDQEYVVTYRKTQVDMIPCCLECNLVPLLDTEKIKAGKVSRKD